MKPTLKQLLGPIPTESGFKHRMRLHQGWWRTFVLCEEPGPHPIDNNTQVCNTIENGETTYKNFLSPNIIQAVEQTLHNRNESSSGIIEEDRLFNNLLSSQPLCFNFFGELKIDTAFALQILKTYIPDITEVKEVIFEYAPKENYTNDNSAFDVAIEVKSGNRSGLFGLECKYTDSFSPTEFDKPEYRDIFFNSNVFKETYECFVSSRFNQLFRNQLIAEALVQNKKYDYVITGLFCHQDDKSIEVGKEFQSMLREGSKIFKIITYQDFIESIQKQDISWEMRELSMILWARYCGSGLSGGISNMF